jgi:hypothetical protein
VYEALSLCGEGLWNHSVVVLMIQKKSRDLVRVFSIGLSLGWHYILDVLLN